MQRSFSARKDRQYREVLSIFFAEEKCMMQDSAKAAAGGVASMFLCVLPKYSCLDGIDKIIIEILKARQRIRAMGAKKSPNGEFRPTRNGVHISVIFLECLKTLIT